MKPKNLTQSVYPEAMYGGYSRCDGSVEFQARVQSILPTHGTCLDIGCGRGVAFDDTGSSYRARLHDLRGPTRKVIGIDVDEVGVENPSLDEFRLLTLGKAWPIESASIDVAMARTVLEHVPNPHEFFAELHRVLKPGGMFAINTTNLLGYPGLISACIPNRFHTAVISRVQPGREDKDVFPTLYRCNTKWAIERAARRAGFDVAVYGWTSEPNYFAFSSVLFRIGAIAHLLIPSSLGPALFAFGQRPH